MPSPATARFGIDRALARRSALADLARHTSHDTVLIAAADTTSGMQPRSIFKNLTREDIDGLSRVVHGLGSRHLDLVLHGSSGGLDAAGELVFLLRSRYDSMRAIVPNAALSVMTLITLVCDSAIMPDTARLGVADDLGGPHIAPDQATDWMAHNCNRTDIERRIDAAATLFADEDSARSPITAAHASNLGLPFHVVGERSGIGAELQPIGKFVDRTFRARPLVKLILDHRGVYYAVQG